MKRINTDNLFWIEYKLHKCHEHCLGCGGCAACFILFHVLLYVSYVKVKVPAVLSTFVAYYESWCELTCECLSCIEIPIEVDLAIFIPRVSGFV